MSYDHGRYNPNFKSYESNRNAYNHDYADSRHYRSGTRNRSRSPTRTRNRSRSPTRTRTRTHNRSRSRSRSRSSSPTRTRNISNKYCVKGCYYEYARYCIICERNLKTDKDGNFVKCGQIRENNTYCKNLVGNNEYGDSYQTCTYCFRNAIKKKQANRSDVFSRLVSHNDLRTNDDLRSQDVDKFIKEAKDKVEKEEQFNKLQEEVAKLREQNIQKLQEELKKLKGENIKLQEENIKKKRLIKLHKALN